MSEETLTIQSHKGPYSVAFGPPFAGLEKGLGEKGHLIIDEKVATLYREILAPALEGGRVVSIKATEENKSLEQIPNYINRLTKNGIRRGDELVAVGGGIIQDIAAFIAAVLFRGVAWRFYPTTLLAQADSCIGSKTSINVGGYKNQVGTFTPPQSIHIAVEVLETLTSADFRSGLGEVIKVHLIAGRGDFNAVRAAYPALRRDRKLLIATIRRSLEIKKVLIEKDEFDQKERLTLNYGHSFGHALEAATSYAIPHGIAVTIGIAMANFISKEWGLLSPRDEEAIYPLLRQNYDGFEKTPIPKDRFFESLARDKKNVGKDVSLILTKGPGVVFRGLYPFDTPFRDLCTRFFSLLDIR